MTQCPLHGGGPEPTGTIEHQAVAATETTTTSNSAQIRSTELNARRYGLGS